MCIRSNAFLDNVEEFRDLGEYTMVDIGQLKHLCITMQHVQIMSPEVQQFHVGESQTAAKKSQKVLSCRLKRHSSAINKLCIFCGHLTSESFIWIRLLDTWLMRCVMVAG